MGYTTSFEGSFTVTPTLTPEHRVYLKKFGDTRRIKRNPQIASTLPDPVREAVGLPIGNEAEYFVGGTGFAGQGEDASIINYSRHPASQPNLWCQWVPNEIGDAIVWDEGEKFYDYTEWMQYLLDRFLTPWGYSVEGKVKWQGEDANDRGVLYVENGRVTSIPDTISNTPVSPTTAESINTEMLESLKELYDFAVRQEWTGIHKWRRAHEVIQKAEAHKAQEETE